MICSYAWDEVTGDFPIVGTILVVIAMSIWSCFLGLGIKAITEDSAQHVLEDYHRGKIKTVITTIQSDGNLIKQDTTYHYVTYHFYNEEGISIQTSALSLGVAILFTCLFKSESKK